MGGGQKPQIVERPRSARRWPSRPMPQVPPESVRSGPPPCRSSSNSSGDSARCMATGILCRFESSTTAANRSGWTLYGAWGLRPRRSPEAAVVLSPLGEGAARSLAQHRPHRHPLRSARKRSEMRFGQFHRGGDAIGGRGNQLQEGRDFDRRSRKRLIRAEQCRRAWSLRSGDSRRAPAPPAADRPSPTVAGTP